MYSWTLFKSYFFFRIAYCSIELLGKMPNNIKLCQLNSISLNLFLLYFDERQTTLKLCTEMIYVRIRVKCLKFCQHNHVFSSSSLMKIFLWKLRETFISEDALSEFLCQFNWFTNLQSANYIAISWRNQRILVIVVRSNKLRTKCYYIITILPSSVSS